MGKYLIGSITDILGRKEKYYTKYCTHFYDELNLELSKDRLEEWAIWLNSPWSIANERYIVELNCKDAYTAIPKDVPQYRCKYIVVGYEGVISEIYGYGKNPEEALLDCITNFEVIQKKYNPNDESL